MEARFKKVIPPADASFIIRQDGIDPNNFWHYHPEFELLCFTDAHGTNFIGDSIEAISDDEVLLLGPNLPHSTQRDKSYYEMHKNVDPKVMLVQFDRQMMGETLWSKSEFIPIAEMLRKSNRGLRFTGETARLAKEIVHKMYLQKGVRKIILLLCLLDELAGSQQTNFISSCGFLKHYDETNDKINTVYEFTINNFREDITLEKISSLVFLSQSAFCRYFKYKTSKTYTEFLTEVRIGYACRLLLLDKLNISEICYECGYKNISNFNRHFKDIMQLTPSEYQRHFTGTVFDTSFELVA